MLDPGELEIGPLLRALREQAGRSQSEQAAVLSDFAGRAVTRNEVSRWESQRRLLTPFWQAHYAASLAVPVAQLRRAVAAVKAQRRREQHGRDLDPVQRRQFLGVVGGIALPVRRGTDLPTAGRLGAADVDRLYRHTARLRRLDNILGGADTYQLYTAQTTHTEQLLATGQFSDMNGRRLRSLLGEQHQMAGWAAFDAGQHAHARQHYTASLTLADEAEDAALAGNALAFVAYQQTMTAQNGTKTAQASYDRASAVATPRVATLLLERAAWAHAMAGDHRQADAALNLAREALQRHDDRPEPDWVFWVDDREVDIMTGRCWTELRRPLRAVPVLEAVLADFDDTHARDKALYLTWLGSSYLQAREIERAATTLARAHELAAGVGSVRPAARISSLARQLRRHRGVPEVAEVLERISAYPAASDAVVDSNHAR
jgi:tetratricopeptide (TPR) repeat protein